MVFFNTAQLPNSAKSAPHLTKTLERFGYNPEVVDEPGLATPMAGVPSPALLFLIFVPC